MGQLHRPLNFKGSMASCLMHHMRARLFPLISETPTEFDILCYIEYLITSYLTRPPTIVVSFQVYKFNFLYIIT